MKSVAHQFCLIAFAGAAVIAAPTDAQPAAEAIPPARDIPFEGTVKIHVDMTDVERGIVPVHETVPATSGPMTLTFPHYLDGFPTPPGSWAGFVFAADGKTIAWRRDTFDMFAFHLDIPAGVHEVTADYQYMAPVRSSEGRVVMTPDMIDLRWSSVAMYPAGWAVRNIPVSASLTIPAGWAVGTALVQKSATPDGRIEFETLSYDELQSRSVMAGRHERTVDLAPDVQMHIFGDTSADIAATDDQIARYRRVTDQAVKMMGGRHYRDYHFLLAVSDKLGGIGMGGGPSSEIGSRRGFFSDWDKYFLEHIIAVHEYLHSWNGNYRVPVEWVQPDFTKPIDPAFDWMIEGLTDCLAYEVQARAGIATPEVTRAMLASVVAENDTRSNRKWQPVADNVHAGSLGGGMRWHDWQTYPNYYEEGSLIWLDVDMLIRNLSHDRRSLDDFARAFFGLHDGETKPLGYTMADVVAALNAVQPYDWASYFHKHVDEIAVHPPTDWLASGGYRLVYTSVPNEVDAEKSVRLGASDFRYSIGLRVDGSNRLMSVNYGGPAFQGGLMPGDELQTVNGAPLTVAALTDAIARAAASKQAIGLTYKRHDNVRSASIFYFGGLRYPHLERLSDKPVRLDAAFKPL